MSYYLLSSFNRNTYPSSLDYGLPTYTRLITADSLEEAILVFENMIGIANLNVKHCGDYVIIGDEIDWDSDKYYIDGGYASDDLNKISVFIHRENGLTFFNPDTVINPYTDKPTLRENFMNDIQYEEYLKTITSFTILAGYSTAWSNFRKYCEKITLVDYDTIMNRELEALGGYYVKTFNGKTVVGRLYFIDEKSYMFFCLRFS